MVFPRFLKTLVATLAFVEVTKCYDVCNPDELIKNNITSYKYKQEPIQKCGCPDHKNCVKKCCARGFNIEKKWCILSARREFSLPVFRRNVSLSSLTPELHYVGVLKHCDFYARIPWNPEDMFHLQEDLSLYLPLEQEFLSPENYCLDYTSEGLLIALVCISRAKPPLSVKINYVGGYSTC